MISSVSVKNLGKAYKQYPTKLSRLKEWILAKKYHSLKWVLRDINFNINPGDSVGIIGINGAGKSTLLKLITGTATPTEGDVTIRGRVAALLELGMGFHPDFTGRQNVFMSGQLLGLSVPELEKLMPEIIKFSEIGDYIDQPVRVYSSGMQVRLAFSVATAVRPDVLIIDEALSVGDAYFQHKSFERIKEFKKQGTTLLIVSHDKQAIQNICDKVILISNGQKIMEGEPEAVLDYYNALLSDNSGKVNASQNISNGNIQTISGNGDATFVHVNITDVNGKPIEVITVGQRVTLKIELAVNRDLKDLCVGYLIKNRLGEEIFGTNTYYHSKVIDKVMAGETIHYKFTFDANIGEGNYSVSVAAHMGHNHLSKNYEWKDLAFVFTIVNTSKNNFVGSSWIPPTVEYCK
ncbi:lipopolysaccharide transport system ATP-binding protein [Yersinia bercovieri]|nr:ABC transporter ATP-binding protein [Yersinia bercovieri]CNH84338.1 lipopolysaccharide transport system ATP-binding protein [Yersinia bercovieri]